MTFTVVKRGTPKNLNIIIKKTFQNNFFIQMRQQVFFVSLELVFERWKVVWKRSKTLEASRWRLEIRKRKTWISLSRSEGRSFFVTIKEKWQKKKDELYFHRKCWIPLFDFLLWMSGSCPSNKFNSVLTFNCGLKHLKENVTNTRRTFPRFI